MSTPAPQVPAAQTETGRSPLRFVTAASLFDGHDAAINIMRRLIQAQGVEVIHLGHNRSVEDVVRAALQEDADAIALSSYQGGHVEYFKYMVDMLRERGAGHIRGFGGGGGTITPAELAELEAYGVERIYHPNDGMHMGLVAMIEDVVRRVRVARKSRDPGPGTRDPEGKSRELKSGDSGFDPAQWLGLSDELRIGQALSAIENETFSESGLARLRKLWSSASPELLPHDSVSRFPGSRVPGPASRISIPESRQRYIPLTMPVAAPSGMSGCG